MLDKGIKHGKEKRKEYYGTKKFDRSCRNHGSCTYCAEGRQHFDKKKRSAATQDMKEYERGSCDSGS